jgi:hypothetical protein
MLRLATVQTLRPVVAGAHSMKLGFLKRNVVTFALIILVFATSHTQIVNAVDQVIDGNLIFTGPGQGGARDIHTSTTTGGLRIYNGQNLTVMPDGAAIQFFGNGSSGYPGQAFIDSGASNTAAIVFRTAPTSGTITERMRINAQGQITMGPGSRAYRYGELAMSNGSFDVPGDAQSSIFILRGQVSYKGSGELFLDGVNQRLTVPPDHTLALDVQGVLRDDFNSAGFSCTGVIQNHFEVTSILGGPVACAVVGRDIDITLSADDATDSLMIQIVPIGYHPHRYNIVATVRTTEVGRLRMP